MKRRVTYLAVAEIFSRAVGYEKPDSAQHEISAVCESRVSPRLLTVLFQV